MTYSSDYIARLEGPLLTHQTALASVFFINWLRVSYKTHMTSLLYAGMAKWHFTKISFSEWLATLVYVLKSAAHFLWDNIEEKSNFSPLNLRMLNSKESTKAIKLIAPPKTQAIPYPKHVSAFFKAITEEYCAIGLWRSCMASDFIRFIGFIHHIY